MVRGPNYTNVFRAVLNRLRIIVHIVKYEMKANPIENAFHDKQLKDYRSICAFGGSLCHTLAAS